MAERGRFMRIAGAEGRRACRSLEGCAADGVALMERTFGRPLDQMRADRMPVLPQRVAAVA